MQERPDSFRRRRRQSIPLDGEIGWPRAERASERTHQPIKSTSEPFSSSGTTAPLMIMMIGAPTVQWHCIHNAGIDVSRANFQGGVHATQS